MRNWLPVCEGRDQPTTASTGELTVDQLAAWSPARPDEVVLVNGELEWIVMTTPEVAD